MEETTMDEDILKELEYFCEPKIAKSYTSYAMWRYESRRSSDEVQRYEAKLVQKYPQLATSTHESIRERSLEIMGEIALVKG